MTGFYHEEKYMALPLDSNLTLYISWWLTSYKKGWSKILVQK